MQGGENKVRDDESLYEWKLSSKTTLYDTTVPRSCGTHSLWAIAIIVVLEQEPGSLKLIFSMIGNQL